ncbi:MAG: FUSC family protein, partial [Ferruginibacter sp.]|nr:FUSC family protein [Ferruginibacter sp.]
AGPVHHRLNGMFFCIIIISLTSIVTYFSLFSIVATATVILVFGFIFSMLSVYNARVSSVGISALLIMVLCMQTPLTGSDIFLHAMYISFGGLWYIIFSITLHSIKPYKIIQQLSGEFLNAVAEYLKTRASFYDDHPDYEATYKSLLQQQVHIQTQQAALNELLFKTRAITKNSTRAGRSLLKIYIDVADLFESIMSTYQQYDVLHKRFDETGILEEYRKQLLYLSEELSEIAAAVSAGNSSNPTEKNTGNLLSIRQKFEALRQGFMNEKNLNDFIGLGRIFNNIKGLTEKINGLHYYTHYEKSQRKATETGLDLQKFNEAQNIDPSLLLNNLNFKSNIFRHSLRVSLSLLLGFIISIVFHIGHSYWILLTIIVILKPAYSLTKARNRDRLIGTFIGVFIGVMILFVVKNNLALMIIMVLFMAGCYMFIRTKYFVSVLLMTPYLVIFFHLTYPSDITSLLYDRLLDTSIGSAIAFVSSLFLVPAWEHTTIKNYMEVVIEKNIIYYKKLSFNFTVKGKVKKEDLKTARQHALTALANVSDAFNRMLSEPKRFQKNTEQVYRFVVLNHILTSHFSALSFFLADEKRIFKSDIFLLVIENTVLQLQKVIDMLDNKTVNAGDNNLNVTELLKDVTEILLEQRKLEINARDLETETKLKFIEAKSVTDQFTYIYNISGDILKNVSSFMEEQKTTI